MPVSALSRDASSPLRQRLFGLAALTAASVGAMTFGTPASAQPVAIGAAQSPTTGQVYVLLSQSTWTQARAKAEAMGGQLATITEAAENTLIYDQFSRFGNLERSLWIGLHDLDQTVNSTNRTIRRGEFGWASGDPVTYTNWSPSEPNNPNSPEPGTWEFYVHIWHPGDINRGRWNNLRDISSVFGRPVCGVVEMCSFPITPSTVNACIGGTAVLNATAFGTGPFVFQWSLNGVPISLSDNPTAMSSSLVISAVDATELGPYTCSMVNACGSSTSDPTWITPLPDFDLDGLIDTRDLIFFLGRFGQSPAPGTPAARADFNADGRIDVADLTYFLARFGQACP